MWSIRKTPTENSGKKAQDARNKGYMAKRSSVAKQKKRERLVQGKWDKRAKLKKVILNMNKPIEERLAAVDALNKMPKNSSPIRLRNRCQFTGRARGFLRKFGLSRLCFREMANQGLIPGIVKASW
ncbi:MAG: hypothetical protein RL235_724 [Chlamydiota bacterium]|jgi:small subunit ribosomal protein S14